MRDDAHRNFILVEWPAVQYDEIIVRINKGEDKNQFEHMCISMISHPESNDDTFVLLERWDHEMLKFRFRSCPIPPRSITTILCACAIRARTLFTVALDAVTPEIFDRTRGKSVDSPHKWEKYWRTLEWAAKIYGPEKFGAYLICGMGETEQEILQVAQSIRNMGSHNHMFAFFPECGSLMEDWEPVLRGQWRRVQLARYLIDYAGGHVSRMQSDAAGRVVDYGFDCGTLDTLMQSGKPFQTSGCPGHQDDISACNRPYGDSMPADIRSFPFALDASVIERVQRPLQGGHWYL